MYRFIAEESAANNILTNEPTWILDPIDGTTNFVQGFPFCCISLALSIENNLMIGIVYNPIMNQLFTAQKGKGSYLNNEKIHVSQTEGNKTKQKMHWLVLQYKNQLTKFRNISYNEYKNVNI